MHTHLEQWAADAATPGEQLGVRCLAQWSHLSRGQFLPEPRFEPTTSGYKSNALFIRPRLPFSLHLTHPKCIHTHSSGQPCYGARGAVGGSVPCSRAPQSGYWRWRECWLVTSPNLEFLPGRDSNPQTLGYKLDSLTIRPWLPQWGALSSTTETKNLLTAEAQRAYPSRPPGPRGDPKRVPDEGAEYLTSSPPEEPDDQDVLPHRLTGNSGNIHFESGGRQPLLQPILQERDHNPDRASTGDRREEHHSTNRFHFSL